MAVDRVAEKEIGAFGERLGAVADKKAVTPSLFLGVEKPLTGEHRCGKAGGFPSRVDEPDIRTGDIRDDRLEQGKIDVYKRQVPVFVESLADREGRSASCNLDRSTADLCRAGHRRWSERGVRCARREAGLLCAPLG